MMMYFQVYCLLLLVITAGVRVDCEVNDIRHLLQWDVDCDSYNITTGARPRVEEIKNVYSMPSTECRSICTGSTYCGAFYWRKGKRDSTGDVCFLYNINDQIIDQYFSQNWYDSLSGGTWHSKTCGYNVGDNDLSCNSYTDRVYHSQAPVTKWLITFTNNYIPDLTATECQQWCTLYTSCRSATYIRDNVMGGRANCFLYPTTIQDLLDRGLDDDVVDVTWDYATYTTYDRYCGDGTPYVPVGANSAIHLINVCQAIRIY